MGSGCAIAPQNASLQRKVPATHSIVPRIRTIRRCKFATPRDFNLNVPQEHAHRARNSTSRSPIRDPTPLHEYSGLKQVPSCSGSKKGLLQPGPTPVARIKHRGHAAQSRTRHVARRSLETHPGPDQKPSRADHLAPSGQALDHSRAEAPDARAKSPWPRSPAPGEPRIEIARDRNWRSANVAVL